MPSFQTNGKSNVERQAEVDAAHLVLLLAKAKEMGLISSAGKVNAEACDEVLQEGVKHCVTPRHDLLEPAKLLTEIVSLRSPAKLSLEVKSGFSINIELRQVDRTVVKEVAGLWSVTDFSARQNVPDVLVCREGVLVQLQGRFYLLAPQDLYASVADAFGQPLTKESKRGPEPPPFPFTFQWPPGDGDE